MVADAAVQYKSEAFYREVLVFNLDPTEFGKDSFDLMWRAREQASGREVAQGETGIVFLDYATHRVARVPEAFMARCGG